MEAKYVSQFLIWEKSQKMLITQQLLIQGKYKHVYGILKNLEIFDAGFTKFIDNQILLNEISRRCLLPTKLYAA